MLIKLNSEYANYPVVNTDYVQYFRTSGEYGRGHEHYYYYIDILFASNTEVRSFCYGTGSKGLEARDKDFERLTKLCVSTTNPPAEKAEEDARSEYEEACLALAFGQDGR